ncbi:MAG: pilus assembly protein N-terminal domain-containing protein [Proteobacteria bacterium]|nr:pilus assembly protein N-terminal domain-containing protein [Pseudomonadota bacterium]
MPSPARLPFARALVSAGMAIATMFAAGTASAQDLVVKYDQSQLLRLPRPVAEIIIGNPTIVDVAVQASDMLVVTGKTFGVTNVILLDADRNVIQDQRVVVTRESASAVSLFKGGKRETYNCSPQCNPAPTVGDDQAWYEGINRNSERKSKLAEGASDGSIPAGQ